MDILNGIIDHLNSELATIILRAAFAEFVWPNNLLFSILQASVMLPEACQSFLANWMIDICGGFIDQLYPNIRPSSEDYNKAISGLGVYIGALLTRRLLTTCWGFMKFTLDYLGANFIFVPILVTACLCVGVSWRYASPPLTREVNSLWDTLVTWLLIGATNLIYLGVLGLVSAWGYVKITASLISTLFLAMISPLGKLGRVPPLKEFSYSSAGEFNPNTQIRLLRIHRRIPFLQLSADIFSHSLDSPSSYHAISYVWRHGPQDMRTIVLNGNSFCVRGNVHDILVGCSSWFGPRYIWIDTICINQGSDNEKTCQVRKMSAIYAGAAHVLVCLGGTSSLAALSLVSELRFLERTYGRDFVIAHVEGFKQRRYDLWLRFRIESLVSLLQHQWFSRVWVVQEAVVASKVTIFYGGKPIDWMEFHEWRGVVCYGPILTTMAAIVAKSPSQMESVTSKLIGYLSMPFLVGYRVEHSAFGPQRLSHVLRLFGEKESTASHDKVFALVGLAAEKNIPAMQRLIDYSRPIDEILTDLAASMVKNGQALEVLDLAGLRQHGRIPTLPSWAVDWTATRAYMPLNSEFLSPELQCRATLNMPSLARHGKSKRELISRGQHFDRISHIAPVDDGWRRFTAAAVTEFPLYPDRALSLARQTVRDPYQFVGQGQPLDEAVWRTLIGDKTNSARPAPSSCGRTMETLFGLIRQLGELGIRDAPFTGVLLPEHVGMGRTETEREEIRRAEAEFQEMSVLFDSGKWSNPFMFCVTEKGYMGMVPHVSKPGDEICLIYGMKVPCVLREFEGTEPSGKLVDEEVLGERGHRGVEERIDGREARYSFVGDSYIHGIMDGEALGQGKECDFVMI
ncbi:hypothetical protein OQA88_10854 [Cercophora sp. LCS_1]